MDNQDATDSNLASAVIRNLLHREGVTKVLSAQIGVELNNHRINYRAGGMKLKNYLQTNVSGLKLIEKIGLDEFWGFGDEGKSTPLNSELPVQDSPWKELASPGSSRTVAWSKSERCWLVMPPEMMQTTDHWVVNAVTKAELTRIANEFADQYEEALKGSPELLAAIRRNDVSWYQQFTKIFPQLTQNWSDIRINGITKIIKERLSEVRVEGQALPETDLAIAIAAMDSIRQQASPSRPINTRARRTPPALSRKDYESSNSIRELAIRAVSNMSDSELRKIWLPLGSIFDAID